MPYLGIDTIRERIQDTLLSASVYDLIASSMQISTIQAKTVHGAGYQKHSIVTPEIPERVLTLTLTMKTTEHRDEVRRAFSDLLGQLSTVWVPSLQHDFILNTAATVGAASLEFKIAEDDDLLAGGIKRHIRGRTFGGVYKITSPVVDEAAGTTTVTISPTLAFNESEDNPFEVFYLCRFSEPQITIETTGETFTDSRGTHLATNAIVKFREVQRETA